MKYNNKKLIISLVVIHSLTSSTSIMAKNDSEAIPQSELVLTYLMQAELAASRNLFKEALDNYLIVAELTNNPEIAEIAAEYALELKDASAALHAADLWAQNAPDNLEAQLIALSLLIDHEPRKASGFLQTAFKLEPVGIEEHLVTILYKISEIGRNNLTQITRELANIQPNNLHVQLSIANLLANQLMIDEAKIYLAQTFKISPKCAGAMQLKAKLIRHESGSDSQALEYLKANVKKYPDNFVLREFYTNALIDNGKMLEAVEQLKILANNKEYGSDAALQLGEFYLASNDYKNANKYLHLARAQDTSKDLAHYNLGQVAESQQKHQEAVQWYVQINPQSPHHTNGFLRAAFLYASEKNYEMAFQILQNTNPKNFAEQKQILLTQIDLLIDVEDFEEANNTASQVLAVVPHDIEFLYVRSIILNNLQQYQPAINDLLLLIELEPNHANALNTMAYTMGNHPEKIGQALSYIEQALSIAPNNPAFMDSKAWLLFKNGQLEQALLVFKQAYNLSQEVNIANHYGEVLWSAGKTKEAKKIWAKALKTNPHPSNQVNSTLGKYNLTPADL